MGAVSTNIDINTAIIAIINILKHRSIDSKFDISSIINGNTFFISMFLYTLFNTTCSLLSGSVFVRAVAMKFIRGQSLIPHTCPF